MPGFNYHTSCAPKFGALKNTGTLTLPQRSDLVKNTLKCKWIRSRVVLDNWSGSASIIETNEGLDLKQVLTLVAYPTGSGAQPWPTDLETLYTTVADILDTYPYIQYVVCDNEEMNTDYHSGTIEQYCDFFHTVYSAAHTRGVKVANGGFGNEASLNIHVYRWLVAKYGQSTADDYGGWVMNTAQINAAKTPGSNPVFEALVTQMQTVLDNVAYLDLINVHGYEVFDKNAADDSIVTAITPNIWRYRKEYFESYGRPVMSNEVGHRFNQQPDLVTNMLNEFYRLRLAHTQWYDGTDDDFGVRPLTNDNTGALLPNGEVFKDFMEVMQA